MGGPILSLARSWPEARVHWLVLAAHGDRIDEARTSAEAFLAGLREPTVEILSRRDGYLPYEASEVKDTFEALKARIDPDLVFTHTRDDLHQDHRLVCDLTWNTFRDHLVLEYEIPKYDGDLGRPNAFVALDDDVVTRKLELLEAHFGSQRSKDWFDDGVFRALMRLRGMECRSPSGYAEGFTARKLSIAVGGSRPWACRSGVEALTSDGDYLQRRAGGSGSGPSASGEGWETGRVARASDRLRGIPRYLGYAFLALLAFGLLAAPAQNAQPSDLVAAYAFNEGSGSTVADLSGNGNVGTLSGASWTTAGKFGSALAFNGSNARVRVEDSASLDLTSAVTLEAWVYPAASQSGWRAVVQKEADSYLLSASSHVGDLRPATGVTVNGSVPNAFGPSALPVGAWTHLAMTYDGAALRLFVNGVQVASTPVSGNITPTANPLWIGGNSPYGEYFAGRIDEVRVYRVALSQAEIQADMAAPLGGPPDTTVPSQVSGLVASAVSSSRVDLSWSAASDNVGVTGYEVERCQGAGCSSFAAVTTVSTLSWSDTGRSPGTSYSYRVRARDAAGNTGAYSSVATAVTPAAVDNPPSAPTGLSAAAAGSGGVNLSWTAATDDLGVATYEVERCQGAGCSGFVQVATTASTSLADTGLVASTSYSYRVRARDTGSQVGPYSSVASATTGSAPPPPPAALVAAYAFDEGSGTHGHRRVRERERAARSGPRPGSRPASTERPSASTARTRASRSRMRPRCSLTTGDDARGVGLPDDRQQTVAGRGLQGKRRLLPHGRTQHRRRATRGGRAPSRAVLSEVVGRQARGQHLDASGGDLRRRRRCGCMSNGVAGREQGADRVARDLAPTRSQIGGDAIYGQYFSGPYR